MKPKFAILFVACLFSFGCDQNSHQPARIPRGAAVENWGRYGSCPIASVCNLLVAQGRHEQARYLRSHYSGGAWPGRMAAISRASGIDFAQSDSHNVAFIERACETRRGAGISCRVMAQDGRGRWSMSHHMICLLGLTDESATIREVNPIDYRVGTVDTKHGPATVLIYDTSRVGSRNSFKLRTLTMPREQFIKLWTGWAITPTYSPLPPLSPPH